MLENSDHAQQLHEQGHPWLNHAIRFQDLAIPFPPWITLRSREIRAAHEAGLPLPNRLSSDPTLVARDESSFKRSEEHTSELQSLMRISYAVFCLKKKKTTIRNNTTNQSKLHN